jgi:hypothetical protein
MQKLSDERLAEFREWADEAQRDTVRMDKLEALREALNQIEGPGGCGDLWRITVDVRGVPTETSATTLRAAIDAIEEPSHD